MPKTRFTAEDEDTLNITLLSVKALREKMKTRQGIYRLNAEQMRLLETADAALEMFVLGTSGKK